MTGPRKLKTYRVSFSVTDFYVRELRARSVGDALAKAQKLYDQNHEAAFHFDINNGGINDDWQAEEVKP